MIPLYSLYTPSHAPLKERYFQPTVPASFDLRMHFAETEGEGQICDPGWCRGIIRKIEVILAAVKENWGTPFVWSDVDVQFFEDFSREVPRLLQDHDLLFQVDAPMPVLCSGFFFGKGTEAVRRLWLDVLEFVKTPESKGQDQQRVQDTIWDYPDIKAGYLPLTYAGGGTFTGQVWEPGREFPIPENMIVHHANFTIGVANKIAQCEYVRGLRQRGEFLPLDSARQRMRRPDRLSF